MVNKSIHEATLCTILEKDHRGSSVMVVAVDENDDSLICVLELFFNPDEPVMVCLLLEESSLLSFLKEEEELVAVFVAYASQNDPGTKITHSKAQIH